MMEATVCVPRIRVSVQRSSAGTTSDSTDISELIAAGQRGDRVALGAIFERYRDPVLKLALGRLRGDRELAMDIVQETFIKGFRALERFEHRASPLTWFCQIAINLIRDHYRRVKRRKVVSLDGLLSSQLDGRGSGTVPLDTSGPQPVPSQDPLVEAQGRELTESLELALAQIPDKHREIFVLNTVKGLSYKEMATVLGISIGTVMSRLFYARKKLRGLLREYDPQAPERLS